MKRQVQYIFSTLLLTFIASPGVRAQVLTTGQIHQIEEIAQNIARQHNINAASMLDNMTVSTRAGAVGRNVRLEYILRVKKDLSAAKLKEFSDETRREIVQKSCAANAKNPAFDRGLSYTFTYTNTYGDNLAEITVDKEICNSYR